MNTKTKSEIKINPLVEKAITLLGGQTALAKACGVSQAHVWNWLRRDKRITLENALKIERATGGEITQKQLRPDLYNEESIL